LRLIRPLVKIVIGFAGLTARVLSALNLSAAECCRKSHDAGPGVRAFAGRVAGWANRPTSSAASLVIVPIVVVTYLLRPPKN